MRFKIHYTIGDYDDSIVITGEDLEECREKAAEVVKQKNPDNYWSEQLDD